MSRSIKLVFILLLIKNCDKTATKCNVLRQNCDKNMKYISGNYKFKMRSSSPNSDDEHAVMLEISKSGKRGYISLKIWGDRKDWDEEQERFIIRKGLRTTEAKKANEDRKFKNDFIERQNIRAQEVIEQFEKNNTNWTINQFKTEFIGKAKHNDVAEYFNKHIDMLTKTGHTGNSRVYSETLHMLELFDSKFSKKVFSEIDFRFVKSFDTFLQKRNVTGNSRSVYHRTLRALINKAIVDKDATDESYPYGRGGFKVASIETSTNKRFLTTAELEKLKDEASDTPNWELARLLFLFSYYCHGINFVDMARLQKVNIHTLDGGDYILYKREKTKNKRNTKLLKIKITPEITRLLDKMRESKVPIKDYLLPIVTVDHSGEKLYKHIKNRIKRINKDLNKLGEELGFNQKLTTYVSRHTMAMRLKTNDISIEMISQIMGHQDVQTTKTYLDDFDTSSVDEAVKVL